jgi:hypothetical protein
MPCSQLSVENVGFSLSGRRRGKNITLTVSSGQTNRVFRFKTGFIDRDEFEELIYIVSFYAGVQSHKDFLLLPVFSTKTLIRKILKLVS